MFSRLNSTKNNSQKLFSRMTPVCRGDSLGKARPLVQFIQLLFTLNLMFQVILVSLFSLFSVVLPELVRLVEPRRDLKPTREPRKKVTAQNLQAMEVKILVNIIRAFGVPIRSGSSASDPYVALLSNVDHSI